MYILSALSLESGLVKVYDTSDNTNDICSLAAVAESVRAGKLKVYGLGKLSSAPPQGSVALHEYGVYFNQGVAQEALVTAYIKMGYTRDVAKQMVYRQ